jgi:hypothetical protein
MESPQAGGEHQAEDEPETDAKQDSKLAQMPLNARAFFAWWNPNRIMALFTVVIAFIGALQVAVYSSQLDEMRELRRPWVGASCGAIGTEYKDICLKNGPLFDEMSKSRHIQPIRWYVGAIHSGNSPGLHAKVTANWCLSERHDDSPPELAGCDGGRLQESPIERGFVLWNPFSVRPVVFFIHCRPSSLVHLGTSRHQRALLG